MPYLKPVQHNPTSIDPIQRHCIEPSLGRAWRFLLCLSLGMSTGAALAAPAPYYLWMSKLDGSRVCAQTSLGEGWQRMGGPFKDSRCRKPA